MRKQRSVTQAGGMEKWFHTFGSLLALLSLVVQVAAQGGNSAPVPTRPFSPPAGPFAVGTHEFLWVDQKREEPFTKDPADRRHLLVRVWYPAEPAPGKE